MDYSYEQKYQAVEREITYRRRVYPRLIEAGKLSQEFADRQIKIFEDILRDYEELAGQEKLPL